MAAECTPQSSHLTGTHVSLHERGTTSSAKKKFCCMLLASLVHKDQSICRECTLIHLIMDLQRMDEEQQAREAAVAARKAKMDAAFKRGGGEALEVGLKERALEDERRAAEQQAAYESKALALQKQKQAERRNKTQEQMEHLKQQVRPTRIQLATHSLSRLHVCVKLERLTAQFCGCYDAAILLPSLTFVLILNMF